MQSAVVSELQARTGGGGAAILMGRGGATGMMTGGPATAIGTTGLDFFFLILGEGVVVVASDGLESTAPGLVGAKDIL
jgi:hypothetical protein